MEMGSENIHAKRGRVIVELLKGREIATKLQTLLNSPDHDGDVSVEELALQISTSFTATLSVLSSCAAAASTESAQIAAVDGGGSACSGESKKKVGVKDRRGCYKRRKSSDSWMTVSSTMEDGQAWRKYGQKIILNSKYPRCYFRCTHKYEGCKALKQVQIIKEDPIYYQTTYFNHHTCTDTLRAPHLILDPDPVEPNLISFQSKPMINNISLVKKEYTDHDHRTQSEDVSDDAKSSLNPWQEIIGLEPWGSYKPQWDPKMRSYQEEEGSGFQSCGSTSLYGLDMEVNQLGDIDNFLYFDDIY
ncbi:hypothetical protein BUALT_Bualt06G0075500 [Buddleja alternifolia]|uniref:WRKY domain-containing protein n=1 Tax=Buddleja alternifolia TaxID=168488 RepID=A0AAV6XLV6_9LAMI|nr:hypothetical protein BUALT_Bualt06G0075500 [Buddleja alternifolia]